MVEQGNVEKLIEGYLGRKGSIPLSVASIYVDNESRASLYFNFCTADNTPEAVLIAGKKVKDNYVQIVFDYYFEGEVKVLTADFRLTLEDGNEMTMILEVPTKNPDGSYSFKDARWNDTYKDRDINSRLPITVAGEIVVAGEHQIDTVPVIWFFDDHVEVHSVDNALARKVTMAEMAIPPQVIAIKPACQPPVPETKSPQQFRQVRQVPQRTQLPKTYPRESPSDRFEKERARLQGQLDLYKSRIEELARSGKNRGGKTIDDIKYYKSEIRRIQGKMAKIPKVR